MNSITKETNKDDVFLSSKDGDYTYGDLHRFARYFTGFLQRHDIKKDQPLGLCANSSSELIFIIASCWLQGIPFAPFNPGSPEAKLIDHINRLTPSLIITDCTSIPTQTNLVHIDTLSLEQALGNTFTNSVQPDEVAGSRNTREENIFGYFLTSGTSGVPKNVPLKRRQMVSAARSSAQNLRPTANELWLLCLPLYHIGGISVILRSVLYGSGIYCQDNFDADATGRLLSKNQKITAASLVSTMLKRLMALDTFNPTTQLKGILLGGGPMPAKLLTECIDRKVPVIPSYGMTETCAQIAANPLFSPPEDLELLRSVGRIFPPNRIAIRDKDGQKAPTNSSGTVWLKGPQVFDGYPDDPDSMLDTNDWFNTGDFGRLDDQGRLLIEARRTDLIITGGENVLPYEVEQALKAVPGIRDAVVVGLSDEEWGQKVAAAVVFEEHKNRPKSELKKLLEKKLEKFKVPKEIMAVDSLPQTETGKVKRSELYSIFK